MCHKIKAASHYTRKCCSFDYHIKYFQIRIVNWAKLHTMLKHCIIYRVPGCNLSNGVEKLKKSYGNYMKANDEKNKTLLMCPKNTELHHTMQENILILITISNIFRLKLQVRLKTI